MVRFQADRGHEVALVALRNSPLAARAAETTARGSTIKVYLADDGPGAARAARDASVTFDLAHMHASQDFNSCATWLARRRLFGARLPAILQLHIWLSHPKRDPWHAAIYRLIDEVWISSEPARAAAKRILPVPAAKLRVLPYGRPVAEMRAELLGRDEARRELDIPRDLTIVGCVSRIDRGKGTRELLEGAVRVMRDRPDVGLAVVGAPSEDEREKRFAEELRARVDALEPALRDRIWLTGPVPRSHRILRAFDLFALPSYRECFSLALMEAQIAALPCIAANAGGSPELVREGSTGWLCEPESIESFADSLDRALDARGAWPQIGARAQKRIESEYDMTRALEATLAGYERVLSTRS